MFNELGMDPNDAGVLLACPKRSDSGERCGVEKAISFLLRTAPHYLNAWNRLVFCRNKLPSWKQSYRWAEKSQVHIY